MSGDGLSAAIPAPAQDLVEAPGARETEAGEAASVPGATGEWTTLFRRLDAVRSNIESGLTRSPAQKKALLRAGALALASQDEADAGKVASLEVIEFLLSGERYGIESTYACEVYPLKDLTTVPCTPAFVFGIINVRGQILSVIDIRKFFDVPTAEGADLSRVIIIRHGEMELGILADSVLGVLSVPLHTIQPSLPTLTGRRAEYLRGVTGDRLALLNVQKLLSDPRIIVHEEVE